MSKYIAVGPNVQVTYDSKAANDRSESSLAVDPTDSRHMVGSSKKFWDPVHYGFTLAAYRTVDVGRSWQPEPQVLPLLDGWAGC